MSSLCSAAANAAAPTSISAESHLTSASAHYTTTASHCRAHGDYGARLGGAAKRSNAHLDAPPCWKTRVMRRRARLRRSITPTRQCARAPLFFLLSLASARLFAPHRLLLQVAVVVTHFSGSFKIKLIACEREDELEIGRAFSYQRATLTLARTMAGYFRSRCTGVTTRVRGWRHARSGEFHDDTALLMTY